MQGGHYKGDTPMIVAKKVALRLFDENRSKGRIVFSIRETTKGSKKSI